MQDYETMYILPPVFGEEQVNEAVKKYQDFLGEHGAQNIEIQNLGKRRLAYEVANYTDGIYIQMNYQADGAHVAPMERTMRLSEDVIRYLTLKTAKSPARSANVAVEVEQEA